jgi:hypothetical protein
MKNLIITSLLLAMFATCTTTQAQNSQENYLGLPGDNLNLFAVMKLFQESETLEGFEKNLNAEDSRINNLDLNRDNYVDYIKVIDYVDGDAHNIVMQVAVNAKENQDVATFTVQRFNNGQVQIQLIGDEALYGKDYIIEPNFDEALAGQTPNPGYNGNSQVINGRKISIVRTTTYELASWPVIRYMYLPTYIGWHSSWNYGYYPSYWHRWRPYYYHYYYGYHYNSYNDYYGHYRYTKHYRYSRWNDYYYHGRRSHSNYVSKRINSGKYKNTYSRPEQRKDGEALYSRTYQSQSNSRRTNSTGNTTVNRRSVSKASPSRQSAGMGTTRRSTTTVTNRSVTTSGQKASPARRSSTSVSRSTGNSNRSGQNYGTTRRSTSSTISRSGAKSNPSPNASSTRTPRRSKSTSARSSNRRSSGSSKSTSAKPSSSSKRSSGSSKSTSKTKTSSSRRR